MKNRKIKRALALCYVWAARVLVALFALALLASTVLVIYMIVRQSNGVDWSQLLVVAYVLGAAVLIAGAVVLYAHCQEIIDPEPPFGY